jgi:uncharacterized protein
MALFKINCIKADTQEQKVIYYDSSLSKLMHDDMSNILDDVKIVDDVLLPATIEKGKSNLSIIKIQLGLSCNFSCEYCNQRFVPHSEETNPSDVELFVNRMDNWYKGDGNVKFEFWGGEPLVYWKTLKPLAEALKNKYPNSSMSMITNGSLLDMEKNDWLDSLGFAVSISHDGPGQSVRGPDPFEDEISKHAILDLYKRLAPKYKLSFNSMINSKNKSRGNIQQYFIDLIKNNLGEKYLTHLVIGEGAFVDAYDEGGLATSLLDEEEDVLYRNLSFNEIRDSKTNLFHVTDAKVSSFIRGITNGKRIESLPQKCGMDKSNNIAVDLNGNVLTCQNVSSVSNNPSGISHKIGHVSNLDAVEVKTGTHWSDREECPKCPVIHLCSGACLFLTGELWEASCNNAFSDNISFFANAIEAMTGYMPMYIDGPQREDRKDIFWWVNGKPEKTRKAKKVIPISVIN